MKIEIWSDVVCPWCYVGKRRLESALEVFDEDVEIEWRSFELDPGAPKSIDGPLDEMLSRKYRLGISRARAMMENMRQMAESEGLQLRFEDAKSGNTLDAHRLIHFAKAKGRGAEMKERLLRAYFTDGLPISDPNTLADLAADVGLDRDAAAEALAAGDFEANVRADEAEARQIGITGVPFFLIDGKFGVSGAQTPDTLLHVLNRAREERATNAPAAAVCDDESCEVPADTSR